MQDTLKAFLKAIRLIYKKNMYIQPVTSHTSDIRPQSTGQETGQICHFWTPPPRKKPV
jgi:hypothetical protein